MQRRGRSSRHPRRRDVRRRSANNLQRASSPGSPPPGAGGDGRSTTERERNRRSRPPPARSNDAPGYVAVRTFSTTGGVASLTPRTRCRREEQREPDRQQAEHCQYHVVAPEGFDRRIDPEHALRLRIEGDEQPDTESVATPTRRSRTRVTRPRWSSPRRRLGVYPHRSDGPSRPGHSRRSRVASGGSVGHFTPPFSAEAFASPVDLRVDRAAAVVHALERGDDRLDGVAIGASNASERPALVRGRRFGAIRVQPTYHLHPGPVHVVFGGRSGPVSSCRSRLGGRGRSGVAPEEVDQGFPIAIRQRSRRQNRRDRKEETEESTQQRDQAVEERGFVGRGAEPAPSAEPLPAPPALSSPPLSIDS